MALSGVLSGPRIARYRTSQDTFDHDKGQKSAISGRRLHWRLSTGFFAFSPAFMCNLVRRAPQNLEKVAKNPVEKIASNPVTSVAVMVLSAPSETISAIPPYCALWGFWCLNMANWVRYPVPLFRAFPLGEHARWRCDTPPPPHRGISAILARYPMKTRQSCGCSTPLVRYYLERVLRDMGGYLALGR